MKKLFKLTTLLLVVTMAFNLMACSSFGKIQKALEEMDYSVIENENNQTAQEAEEDERVANVHLLKSSDIVPTLVIVIEFKSTQKLVEYYKENQTLQGLIADIREDGTAEEVYNELKAYGYACGNCLIAPIGLDYASVLNAIKNLNG